ncbi:MAG: hypothetical protein JNL83_18055 [Myxococcales bacterium]|nr:hypothetical protein [Myxococcales bacterium]
MSRLVTLAAVALCGCFETTDVDPDDVTGPYTGPITRYVVDGYTLPMSSTSARELADDLDGDQHADNQLGMTFGSLASFKNLTTHAPDMVASGVLASIVQIQADDPANDPTVRVWYYGAEGEEAEAVGGALQDGVFASNRTRTTRVPGRARIHLPVFVDTDPVVFDLYGVEMDLKADGRGGFDAIIRGAVREQEAKQTAYDGILAMLAAMPQDHRAFWYIVEKIRDGVVTYEELARQDGLLEALLAPDIEIRTRDGAVEPMLSLAFRVHLSPCPVGRCAPATVADHCGDRVLDGDETDVDCGGSCAACPGGDRCAVADDCQTAACSAGGTCAAATCSDGVQDGYEADVDCGGGCDLCTAGKACDFAIDCASNRCEMGRCL